jgi:putative endonuclease
VTRERRNRHESLTISGMPRQYFVYIMTNRTGTLYTGVTNDLLRRVAQHRSGMMKGFTSRYNVTRLIFFEETADVHAALEREKQIKSWSRRRKLELIAAMNPEWRDLAAEWGLEPVSGGVEGSSRR